MDNHVCTWRCWFNPLGWVQAVIPVVTLGTAMYSGRWDLVIWWLAGSVAFGGLAWTICNWDRFEEWRFVRSYRRRR